MENLADYLHNTERVLCFVFTNFNEINSSAAFVQNTWGKRCNTMIFFSDKLRKLNNAEFEIYLF
jgi:hypothetical protein